MESSSSSSGSAAAAAAASRTAPLHALKRSLRPEHGRNAFHRAWAKQLQIKASAGYSRHFVASIHWSA